MTVGRQQIPLYLPSLSCAGVPISMRIAVVGARCLPGGNSSVRPTVSGEYRFTVIRSWLKRILTHQQFSEMVSVRGVSPHGWGCYRIKEEGE
jgi:hypothetical protein